MLIDTHCHLGDRQFDDDVAAVLARARAAQVGHVIAIADSVSSIDRARELAHQHGISATAGVHPHVASSWNGETGNAVRSAIEDSAVVAVGEIGLDYHYDHSPRADQRRAFGEQLALAAARGLPAIVHSRECDEDMVAMLEETEAIIVLHSFSAGPSVLAVALERGFYVSFSGMVTFRSWKDDEAVRAVPATRLLIETDAPYLAPVPHRGKRNEPAFVTEIARRIAEVRGVSRETIAADTTENAARCFGNRVLRFHEVTS